MILTTNPTTLLLSLLLLGATTTTTTVSAFTPTRTMLQPHFRSTVSCRTSSGSSSSRTALDATTAGSLIVVSPPGGVGEVSAVKAAELGLDVRWFVVSQGKTNNYAQQQQQQQAAVQLAQESLDSIVAAGGSIQLAGADADSLLLPTDDANSAVPAVSTWCGAADAMVCTLDGIQDAVRPRDATEDPVLIWKDAIKLAAQQAAKAVSGTKMAILSALDDNESVVDAEQEEGAAKKVAGLVGNLLGGGKPDIPATLAAALGSSSAAVTFLRHGELFGTPESSPDFSPLIGGPRRDPELCEEYTTRAVRVDPTLSVSGNMMMGSNTRSSRHAVGTAAALMAAQQVPFQPGADVCLSSLSGIDPPSLPAWQDEFVRVEKMLSAGQGAQLFTAEFSSVPDVERLADWLSTKWAPAVLRTYDIATIRSGARPVYATRPAGGGDGKVEIVWQELVNFESATVGRMLIQVSNAGLVAVRGPGDASKGFGSISKKPLPGEAVLVRRLAEAASQALEKGLAKKAVTKTVQKKKTPKPAAPAPTVVSSIQSSGTVKAPAAAASAASESGPRQAGARRSKERARGRKRKSSTSTSPNTTN